MVERASLANEADVASTFANPSPANDRYRSTLAKTKLDCESEIRKLETKQSELFSISKAPSTSLFFISVALLFVYRWSEFGLWLKGSGLKVDKRPLYQAFY